MKKILHIDSSAKNHDSTTRKLTEYAIKKVEARYPNSTITYHDLTADPLAHINPTFIKAMFGGKTSNVTSNILSMSNKLVEELVEADIVIIGAPMYNFAIPSQLKTWIDYICRAGLTFRYTDTGPLGLLTNKNVIVAVGMGGHYSDGPMKSHDHVTPYMRQVFNFIGIDKITIALAEKQSLGKEVAEAEFAKAQQEIDNAVKDF